MESRRPWVVAVGSVVYGIGLGASIVLVVRHAKVQVRPALLGVEGFLAIFGFAGVLAGAGVGLGLGLQAAGVGWPATLSVIPVGDRARYFKTK